MRAGGEGPRITGNGSEFHFGVMKNPSELILSLVLKNNWF